MSQTKHIHWLMQEKKHNFFRSNNIYTIFPNGMLNDIRINKEFAKFTSVTATVTAATTQATKAVNMAQKWRNHVWDIWLRKSSKICKLVCLWVQRKKKSKTTDSKSMNPENCPWYVWIGYLQTFLHTKSCFVPNFSYIISPNDFMILQLSVVFALYNFHL